MSRKTKSPIRVGKTEDQLGQRCPFARIRSYPDCFEDCPDTSICPQHKAEVKQDEATAEIKAIREADLALEQLRKINETVPDGIIRAYRKALRARVVLNKDEYVRDADDWIYGVIWELRQLYPDLNKLPKEENV